MVNKIKSLWFRLPDSVKRVLHTLWEVAIPVFLSHIIIARSSADVKAAFAVTGAVVLATLKAAIVGRS